MSDIGYNLLLNLSLNIILTEKEKIFLEEMLDF